MIHIEITNYESIGHIAFDVEGFTTIVGRNFIGKSAVMRAISAALTNASGTSFIKWGESFCEVRIRNDSIDLLWHKEDGNNFYVINNKKYDKIGRDDPPNEILKAGLGTTIVGKEKLNLLYAEQFFPLFLVDKKDSKGIDLLTAAYGLDKVYKAIDLCNKDQRSINDLLRVRKRDLTTVTEDLKKYEGFEEILAIKSDVVEKKKILEQKQARIENLTILFKKLSIISSQVRILQDIREVTIPNDKSLRELGSKLDKVVKLNDNLIKTSSEVSILKISEEINLPENTGKLKNMKEKLESCSALNHRYNTITSSVKDLSAIESVDLPSMPDMRYEVIDTLETYRQRAIILRDECQGLEKKYKEISKEEDILLNEKDQFQGVCPLCGNKLEDCDD